MQSVNFLLRYIRSPLHPKRPMSWFWCVQNKHTRGREQKKKREKWGGGGIKVKRVFREMESTREAKDKKRQGGLQKERAEGKGKSMSEGKNKRSRRGERIKWKQGRMHGVEEPVGGDLPIKRHSARALWSRSCVVMPDKNTLGRQPLPPEKQLLGDWYANTVCRYSEERREGRTGSQKRRGIEGEGSERGRGGEGMRREAISHYPSMPLYEKLKLWHRNLPSSTQTFFSPFLSCLRSFTGWTR